MQTMHDISAHFNTLIRVWRKQISTKAIISLWWISYYVYLLVILYLHSIDLHTTSSSTKARYTQASFSLFNAL